VGVGRGPGPLRNAGIGSPGCGHPDKAGRAARVSSARPNVACPACITRSASRSGREADWHAGKVAASGSRGGLTSKIHAVVDTNGLPVHLALTPGEAQDHRLCSVLLGALLPKTMLLADRGYEADWIRGLAREQGAWANIPPKRHRKDPICFSPYLYRARNLIERCINPHLAPC
jgi:transposase